MTNTSGRSRRKSRKGRYSRYSNGRRGVAAVGLLAGAIFLVAFLLLAVGFASGDDTIRRGVKIGEVDVGGMTRTEARAALDRQVASRFEQVSFGENGRFSVPGGTLGVRIDTAETIGEAYAVGREGWIGARMLDTVRSYTSGVQVPAAVTYDENAARATVSRLAGQVSTQPTNATFHLNDSGEVEVRGGQPGISLEQEKTLANLNGALENMSNEVPLVTRESGQPQVSAEELGARKPTEMIGSFASDYRWDTDPARRANIKTVSEAVDGTVVAPGEIFSFNEIAIQQSYEAAKVFSEGGVSTSDGGGLCQTSSMVYMAAQKAGMQIVEQHPHYAVLPYIRPGFDATVWFGGGGVPELDMRFRNTNDSYIYVREYVDENGFLRAEIYGQPTGKKVEMSSELIYRDLDRGIKFETYKTVTKNGKVINSGQIREDIYSFPPPTKGPDHTNVPRIGGYS